MTKEAAFAREEAEKYRDAIRANLVDFNTMRVLGECQTSQAMALFYGVFEESEKESAFAELLQMIHDQDDHMDVGVLGGRVIFHVLAEFGYADLAFHMITREDFPSYGNWLRRGATTLWEDFRAEKVSSMNHHFWGDISAWFVKRIAGIQLNPQMRDVNELKIKPSFISALDRASAHHVAPAGKVAVSWKRFGEEIRLTVEIPHGVQATAELEPAYCFENGDTARAIVSGTYKILRKA
jgi:alpha-L-rhamnosidase